MTTLRELGEFELIRRLLAARPDRVPGTPPRGVGSAADAVVVGAGDDAAILRPRAGRDVVTTTDSFVEAVHFDRAWIEPEPLGARLAEANLSDLAAMAAEPRWALVVYGVRADHDADDLIAIQRGIVGALARHGAVVVGGNVTAVRGEEWMTLTLTGEVEIGRAWTRAGARPGDLIALTGCPGRAGAGSLLARKLGDVAREPRWAEPIAAWRAPRARVELALGLARTEAVTAAVDVSDGVSSDLHHLCEASGVGARIEAARWPVDPVLAAAAEALGVPLDQLRLGASDDYELILAVDPARRAEVARAAEAMGVAMSFAGVFTGAPGICEWAAADGTTRPVALVGFDHFGG